MKPEVFMELFEAASIVTTGMLGLSFFLLILWPSLSDSIDWAGFWMVIIIDLVVILNHLRDGKEDE